MIHGSDASTLSSQVSPDRGTSRCCAMAASDAGGKFARVQGRYWVDAGSRRTPGQGRVSFWGGGSCPICWVVVAAPCWVAGQGCLRRFNWSVEWSHADYGALQREQGRGGLLAKEWARRAAWFGPTRGSSPCFSNGRSSLGSSGP